jgi:hypothetical protein
MLILNKIHFLFALFGFAVAFSAAHASSVTPQIGGGFAMDGGVAASFYYVGPADIAAASSCYSLRACSHASAIRGGKAINITRASDSTSRDINVLARGNLDVATATTFCASTTCTIAKWYDQTGNGNDSPNTGTSATLHLSGGSNGLPYADFTNTAVGYTPAATFTASAVSYSIVSFQTSSASGNIMGGQSALSYGEVAGGNGNTWSLYNGAPILTAAAADNAWHAGQFVSNGAASNGIINIDGADTIGTIGSRQWSGTPLFIGNDGSGDLAGGYIAEALFSEAALTFAQRIALSNNEHNYWGTAYSPSGPTLTLSANSASYGDATYLAYNSTWNRGSLVNGTDFTQTISVPVASFPNSTVLTWSWPNTPATYNAYSYPSIMYGYYQSGIAAPILPTSKQVSAISTLTLAHNISVTGDGTKYDVSYDGYLTSAADGSTYLFEVFICLHTPSYLSSYINGLSPLYTYTDANSFVWTIGVKSGTTPEILVMPQDASDILVKTIDLKAMFAFMISQGIIAGTEYFNGIGIGAEPQQGSGSATINSFNVNYNYLLKRDLDPPSNDNRPLGLDAAA